MNKKIFGLTGLSILSLVMLVSFVSAVSLADITVYSIPSSVNRDAGSFDITFNLTNNGAEGDLDFSSSTITSGASIVFDDSYILNDTTETITATISFPATMTGSITGMINVTGTGMSTYKTLSFSVPIIIPTSEEPEEVSACELVGNPGSDLRVKNIDFKNDGFSDKEFGDDDAWFPLDDIEVEIEIENNGNDDIDNVEVEWGLWDTQAKEWVIELDNEKDFDLRDDDEETLTVKFNLEKELDIDLEDLDDGEHYRFYVIATGESQEIDDDVCASDFESVELVIESDFVVLYDFQFPETVSCEGEVQIIADVWNIGDRDQDDVYVRVFNTELGINEEVDIGDIDAFDHEDFNLIIDIPEDAKEKIYSINFEVYDEDDDVFENDFDDDPAEFRILLTVSGSCGVEKSALVSASLESGGKAGEELVVKAIIVNTGTKSLTYNLNAAEYSGWAGSVDIEPSTVLINTGESREVLFTFNVKEDVSGEQTFDIEGVSEGELVFTQPVSVSIEEEGGISDITGGVISGRNNLYLWGIGALNIILVVIIIIVAIRVARK